jgi:hypothetical protein
VLACLPAGSGKGVGEKVGLGGWDVDGEGREGGEGGGR